MSSTLHREKVRETFRTLVDEGRDGFTLTLQGDEFLPVAGYAVGVEPRVESLEEAFEHVLEGQYIGFWIHHETKQTYVDIIIVVNTLPRAMLQAFLTGELYIYDFCSDAVIDIRHLYEGNAGVLRKWESPRRPVQDRRVAE